MNEAKIGSMRELGVTESYKLKRQVVTSATEAAEMILRWDDERHSQKLADNPLVCPVSTPSSAPLLESGRGSSSTWMGVGICIVSYHLRRGTHCVGRKTSPLDIVGVLASVISNSGRQSALLSSFSLLIFSLHLLFAQR